MSSSSSSTSLFDPLINILTKKNPANDDLIAVLHAITQQAKLINREDGVIYVRDLLLTDALFVITDYVISALIGVENEPLQFAILDLLFHLFQTDLEETVSFFDEAVAQALRSSCTTLDIDLMEHLRFIVFDASEATMELRGKACLLLGKLKISTSLPLKREILITDVEKLFADRLNACIQTSPFYHVIWGLSHFEYVKSMLLNDRFKVLDACIATLDVLDSDQRVWACMIIHNLSLHEDKDAFFSASRPWSMIDVCRNVLMGTESVQGDVRVIAYKILKVLSPSAVFALDIWQFLSSLLSSTIPAYDVRAVLRIIDEQSNCQRSDFSGDNAGYYEWERNKNNGSFLGDISAPLRLFEALRQVALHFADSPCRVLAMKLLNRLSHIKDNQTVLMALAKVVSDGVADDRILFFTYEALGAYAAGMLMDTEVGIVAKVMMLLKQSSSDDLSTRSTLHVVRSAITLVKSLRGTNTVLFDRLYPTWFQLCSDQLVSLKGSACMLWPTLANVLQDVSYEMSSEVMTFFEQQLNAIAQNDAIERPFTVQQRYALEALKSYSSASAYYHVLPSQPTIVQPLLQILKTQALTSFIAFPACAILANWQFVIDADTLKQMCQSLLLQVSPSASWRTDYDVLEMTNRITQLFNGNCLPSKILSEYLLLPELFAAVPKASNDVLLPLCSLIQLFGCSVPDDVLISCYSAISDSTSPRRKHTAFDCLQKLAALGSTKKSLLRLGMPLLAMLEAMMMDESIYWKTSIISFIVDMKYLISPALLDHICRQCVTGVISARKRALSQLTSLIDSANANVLQCSKHVVEVCESSLNHESVDVREQAISLRKSLTIPISLPFAQHLCRSITDTVFTEQKWALNAVSLLVVNTNIDTSVFMSSDLGMKDLLNGMLRGDMLLNMKIKLCTVMVVLKLSLDDVSVEYLSREFLFLDDLDHARSTNMFLDVLKESLKLAANKPLLRVAVDPNNKLRDCAAGSFYQSDRGHAAKASGSCAALFDCTAMTVETMVQRVIDGGDDSFEQWSQRDFYCNQLSTVLDEETTRKLLTSSTNYSALMSYLEAHIESAVCFTLLIDTKSVVPTEVINAKCTAYHACGPIGANKTTILGQLQSLANDRIQLPALTASDADTTKLLETVLLEKTDGFSYLFLPSATLACNIKMEISESMLATIIRSVSYIPSCGRMAVRVSEFFRALLASEVARKAVTGHKQDIETSLLRTMDTFEYRSFYSGFLYEFAEIYLSLQSSECFTATFFHQFLSRTWVSIAVLKANVQFVEKVSSLAATRNSIFSTGSPSVQLIETLIMEVDDFDLRSSLVSLHRTFGHPFPPSLCRLFCEDLARDIASSESLYQWSFTLSNISTLAKSPSERSTFQQLASIIQPSLDNIFVDLRFPWSVKSSALNLVCSLELFPSSVTVTAMTSAMADPLQVFSVLEEISKIFLELSKVASFKVHFTDQQLISTLDDVAVRDRTGKLRGYICTILKQVDATPSHALLKLLADDLRQPDLRKALDSALDNISSLASNHMNTGLLLDPDVHLVDALSNLIDVIEPGDTRKKAATVMGKLDVLPELPSLLKLVLEIADTTNLPQAISAVDIVSNMAKKSSNKEQLRWKNLGLLPAMEKTFAVHAFSTRWNMIGIFSQLSVAVPASMVALIAQKLVSGNAEQVSQGINMSNTYIYNCRDQKELVNFLSPSNGLFLSILALVRANPCGDHTISVMRLLFNAARSEEAATILIEDQVPDLILDVFRVYGKDIGSSGYLMWCLTTVMNLSQWAVAYDPLRSLGFVSLFLPVVKNKQNHSIFCMVALSYLVGREENSEDAKQFRSNAQNLEAVLDALSNTVKRQGGDGYTYGYFTFPLIVGAVLTLSISDENKKFLGRQKVTVPLIKILEDFVAGAEGDQMGGGKDDVKSAEYAVEALLQLSFLHDSDEDLRASDLFPKSSTGSLAHLVELLESMDSQHATLGLSAAAKNNASSLLSRLVERMVEVVDVGSAAAGGGIQESDLSTLIDNHTEHVMVSYCWGKNSKPELVKALTTSLRRQGFDVWRDEDGSLLMGSMSGATEDVMSEAIERSCVVIMCISKEYKESANCRLEGKYAQQLYKKGKCRLAFVMMNEDYTTVSKGQSVDGWLGVIVSDQLWYPLWDASKVDSTALQLARLIGDKYKIGSSNSNSTVPQTQALAQIAPSPTHRPVLEPVPSVTNTPVQPKVLTWDEAPSSSSVPRMPPGFVMISTQELQRLHRCEMWEVLTKPRNQIPGKVARLGEMLEELGIDSASSLLQCTEADLQQLGECLKKIPRALFVSHTMELK